MSHQTYCSCNKLMADCGMPDDHSSSCRITWSCSTCLESGEHVCGGGYGAQSVFMDAPDAVTKLLADTNHLLREQPTEQRR